MAPTGVAARATAGSPRSPEKQIPITSPHHLTAPSCGRGLPVLQSIDGRAREQILTRDGKMISTCGLNNFLTLMHPVLPHVWEFQAVQDRIDELVLRVVPTAQYSAAFGDELARLLAEHLGGNTQVRVEAVERIELEPSGKRLVIKSGLAPDERAEVAWA